MTTKTTISVADDFSKYPAGPTKKDSDNSGERFREEFLIPALNRTNEKVEVNLDGTCGYGSSWLKAAFGGLGKKFESYWKTDDCFL